MFLSDAEILAICAPLHQPAALCRRMRAMGFHVKTRPNGWPLVSRANFNIVMMGQAAAANDGANTVQPNAHALLDRFKKPGAQYGDGSQTQKQPARAA
jgi:hypothetical protein